MFVQDTLAICWKSEQLAVAPRPQTHTESKAAARRRRQMERQREREAPRRAQEAERRLIEIEDHQAAHIALVIERALEPSTAPLTESKACKKPKGITQEQLVEWFQKWRKPIRSWFRGKMSVPPGDIDDLAQEVFMRMLRYPDAQVENPQGYIFRIAANVANEWRERSRNRKPHDPEWLDELLMDDAEEPEAITLSEMRTEAVRKAVDALGERRRTIVLLHVNEGKTYKQIAEELGITYRIVLRELTRSYAALRVKLQPMED